MQILRCRDFVIIRQEKELNVIKQEISRALKTTKRVGLIGPSLTDYPFAKDVLKLEGVDFSITSLRAKPKKRRTCRFAEGIRALRIAPEAGTERLRRIIAKKITEDDIIGTSKLILLRHVKISGYILGSACQQRQMRI